MNTRNSVDTILSVYNRDEQSQWSEVWSTSHIPGMDNAAGGANRGAQGRLKLRLRTLALGTFLTMHCRVTASALTGGFCVGIAVCINALVRAIICCTIAAICAMYVVYSIGDNKLPFTYCRDFDLRPYDPILKDISFVMLRESRFSLVTEDSDENIQLPLENVTESEVVTVGTSDLAWRNASYQQPLHNGLAPMPNTRRGNKKIEICNERYTIGYPVLYSTPAYNFFYVEVVLFREDYTIGHFNTSLVICLIVVWTCLWLLLIRERLTHGRLQWNNMLPWLTVIPWIWVALLVTTSLTHYIALPQAMRKVFKIGAKEILAGLADAFEVAIYIHSAGFGTELIHGKGLNHYATGHIDPHLNGENVWHSGLLLLLSGLHSGGAAVCALVDSIQSNTKTLYDMNESTLWIIPMYSQCVLINSYSHSASAIIFSGLMFSYMAVAYMLVKTALHIIFEYKVKLVFAEQVVVAALILCCMGISFVFATNGGVALLDSVDAIMTGISTPFVCLLELVALLYVYRNRDFVSDMNIATEENTCASRINIQWQLIPVISLVLLIIKLSELCSSKLPVFAALCASVALLAVVLAAPLRAARNAIVYLRRRSRK